ncbi:2-hydroxy-3-oxopropionate reductase [Leifsonia sp. EB41]|uniref:2-hydroxy-3-oxopropionate reductase n=1 Tax=Leifsonia sp. EB41 TaxID=3156260 RepID=UPI0035118F7E
MTDHTNPLSAEATTIAFIGLGVMGRPMAANLRKAGYRVRGYNRTSSRADELVALGGYRASDVADAVDGADVVITMLPDSPDVSEVLLADGGVLDLVTPGTVVVDMSTIEPSVSRLVAERAAERGCAALDAPVSGGEQGAIDAALSIMIGGDEATVARVAPIFQSIGKTLVHVGPSGSGQTVKAANQLIVAGNIELVAEALVFLEAQEVDTTAALAVLSGGLAGSTVLARKGTSMIERRFEPGFRIALHDKDLGIYLGAARSARTATPLGAVLGQLMATANAEGDGGLDHSALFRLVERMSGRADR